jgi:hypothetical protein
MRSQRRSSAGLSRCRPDWAAWRAQWEAGHAVSAVLQLAGFAALLLSVVIGRLSGQSTAVGLWLAPTQRRQSGSVADLILPLVLTGEHGVGLAERRPGVADSCDGALDALVLPSAAKNFAVYRVLWS